MQDAPWLSNGITDFAYASGQTLVAYTSTDCSGQGNTANRDTYSSLPAFAPLDPASNQGCSNMQTSDGPVTAPVYRLGQGYDNSIRSVNICGASQYQSGEPPQHLPLSSLPRRREMMSISTAIHLCIHCKAYGLCEADQGGWHGSARLVLHGC